MKIETILNLSDYLSYQLYASSISKLQNKKRKRSKYDVPIVYVLLGILMFLYVNQIFGIALFIFAFLWFLIYPYYLKRHYKKHFENHIKENYQNKIGRKSMIVFDEETGIATIAEPGLQLKVNFSEFDKLIELPNHYFVKIKSDSTLIFPKRFISNHEKFKKIFSDIGVTYVNENNWKW